MDCPECGAVNLDGAERCSDCGVRLEREQKRTSASSWVLYAFVAVAGLAFVALLVSAGGKGAGGGVGSPVTTATAGSAATTASTEATAPPKQDQKKKDRE